MSWIPLENDVLRSGPTRRAMLRCLPYRTRSAISSHDDASFQTQCRTARPVTRCRMAPRRVL